MQRIAQGRPAVGHADCSSLCGRTRRACPCWHHPRALGPGLQASFEETNDILFRAATYAERDIMAGVSENILMGQLCPVGTGAFSLLIDEDKLQGGKGGPRCGRPALRRVHTGCRSHRATFRAQRRLVRQQPQHRLRRLRLCVTAPCMVPLPADAIELDYALVEDAGWGPGVGMTPSRMTPGRSPSHHLRASPSQMASPGMSPFNDNIMFSPMGDGIMFSPGPTTSPGYRWGWQGRAGLLAEGGTAQGGQRLGRCCTGLENHAMRVAASTAFLPTCPAAPLLRATAPPAPATAPPPRGTAPPREWRACNARCRPLPLPCRTPRVLSSSQLLLHRLCLHSQPPTLLQSPQSLGICCC